MYEWDGDRSVGKNREIVKTFGSSWSLIPSAVTSSARAQQANVNGRSMKKGSRSKSDELRPEHKCSDFGEMVRGKYASRAAVATNVVVLDLLVAKAFPTDQAVNEALQWLIDIARASARPTRHSSRRANSTARRPT